jgi:tRNA-splicing ligase RtcB
MSRTRALKQVDGHKLKEELLREGIRVRSASYRGLAEEAPVAYKDVNAVVEVCHKAGLSRKVARLRPIGVVKG